MSVTYVRNPQTNEFELVGPGTATTDTTLSQSGKPADAAAVGSALTGYSLKSHTHTEYAPTDSPVFTSSISMGRKADSAIGPESIAIGRDCVATGDYCCAIGDEVSATGLVSHAEGVNTVASGWWSHAEGLYSQAPGEGCHAEGYETVAGGYFCHTEGLGTISYDTYQHVQGQYNLEDWSNSYAHVVGNGSGDDSRSNCHTLDWDGNAWYAGTVEGTALILTSPNGTRFKVTVSDSGALSATQL